MPRSMEGERNPFPITGKDNNSLSTLDPTNKKLAYTVRDRVSVTCPVLPYNLVRTSYATWPMRMDLHRIHLNNVLNGDVAVGEAVQERQQPHGTMACFIHLLLGRRIVAD